MDRFKGKAARPSLSHHGDAHDICDRARHRRPQQGPVMRQPACPSPRVTAEVSLSPDAVRRGGSGPAERRSFN